MTSGKDAELAFAGWAGDFIGGPATGVLYVLGGYVTAVVSFGALRLS